VEKAEVERSELESDDRLRIVVADDHALFRAGLVSVLDREPDLRVVGEAVDGLDAVDRVRELQPDVLLLDIRMPRRGGIESIGEILAVAPRCRIVMLTQSQLDADLYASIKAGAAGYLLKEIPTEEIAASIRRVASGESVVSPAMASVLLTQFAALIKREQAWPTPGRLTAREVEVLHLVAQGLNNREVGQKLFISENTVKNHMRNILEKLGLRSRMQAVAYAVRERLVDLSGSSPTME
jgi:DNA-binding NarL/FixJ family response regulator